MARFLVVLDVDSTLIEQEAIELLAEQAGTLEQVAEITSKAMAGELDFERSLAERVATLEGLDAPALERVSARVTVTRGVHELVTGIHAADGVVAVVSGGFHELVDPLANSLGLDAHRANRLEIVDRKLTGRTSGPVIDATAKRDALLEWAQRFDVPLHRTVAIGDGANDLEMMAAAGLSIAFDAKPIVRTRANLVLHDRDLSVVLAVLGLN
ncbi:MAG: phosphoserine phosphatase SerB [Microcella sp.]|nr:phosphoserine phosphatase SerB [Microcella sp.]